jgi:hypothetical protein
MAARRSIHIKRCDPGTEITCGRTTLLIEDGDLVGLVLFGELRDLEPAEIAALADLRAILNHPTVVAALDCSPS